MKNVQILTRAVAIIAILSANPVCPVMAQVRQAWVATYDPADRFVGMAVDDTGNVYVTGPQHVSDHGEGYRYSTLKINGDGQFVWTNLFHAQSFIWPEFELLSGFPDFPKAIAVDNEGNVHVTGESVIQMPRENRHSDFATVKYDSNGNLLWTKFFNYLIDECGPTYDVPDGPLFVDSTGNIYISGVSQGYCREASYGSITVKYDSSGNIPWISNLGEGGGFFLGDNDNFYFTGPTGTTKYNPAGTKLWDPAVPHSGKLAVDGAGNVYILSGNSLVKYNSGGSFQWESNVFQPWYQTAFAVDSAGNVVLAASSLNEAGEPNITTAKYNTSGEQVWIRYYSSPDGRPSDAWLLQVDPEDSIYVSGHSFSFDPDPPAWDMVTLKYDADGNLVWRVTAEWFTPALRSLALDNDYNVYLSGDLVISDTAQKAAVIKYIQIITISIAPSTTLSGGAGFTLAANGSCFANGATVCWNGSPRLTTFLSSTALMAQIPASDLATTADITTVLITVVNPGGTTSNPQVFTIVSANVDEFESAIAAQGQSVSVSTAPDAAGEAGVSATANNAGDPSSVSVTAANYTSNPTSGTVFDVGGGYVDLQITGADAADSAMANFYYASTVTGSTEANLMLLYFDGTIWTEVKNSGNTSPSKDTTDSLDGTISGGRFTVLFDNTSTPKITELSGTVFAMAILDTTPPHIACPANISMSCNIDAFVPVSFTASATDDFDPSPTITCNPVSGSSFAVGTTVVTCIARDAAGNSSQCSFTVTREALGFEGFLQPIGGADAGGGSFAEPLQTFKMSSTIPIKFEASCGGAVVQTGSHTLQVSKYSDSTTADAAIEASAAGAATSGNQFVLRDSEWHFNLSTKETGMSVGRWLIRAKLSDGSEHTAWIQLK